MLLTISIGHLFYPKQIYMKTTKNYFKLVLEGFFAGEQGL